MKLSFHTQDLKLKQTFTIARGAHDIHNNLVVVLEDSEGVRGLGEAAPNEFFGEDITSACKVISESVDFFKKINPFLIEDITLQLKRKYPKDAAACAAIDIALHDFVAKKLQVPLYKLLGLNPHITKTTSFTIGIDTIENMCKKVDEVKEFPVLKIKVGIQNDIEILKELRKITNALFRVDANTGWKEDEAIKKIKRMEELGVELIEQPFPLHNIESLKKIRKQVNIPIFADEDVKESKDIPALLGAVDGINIKLMKCGGIREAMRMIHTARSHDLKVMIGCNIESSLSITAASHIVSLVDYVDLDGHLLITNDPYTGTEVDCGKMRIPEGPGLGVYDRV